MAADVAVLEAEPTVEAGQPPSSFRAFWNAFSENRGAVLGLVVVAAICIVAIFAGVLAPHSPTEQFRDAILAPPFWEEGGSLRFVFGTDGVGRDTLSRLMYGARVSLFPKMFDHFALGLVETTNTQVHVHTLTHTRARARERERERKRESNRTCYSVQRGSQATTPGATQL